MRPSTPTAPNTARSRCLPTAREVKISPVDPDAGYMVRDGKPTGFFYLDHRTVVGVHAIITDTHVTPANVHDSQPF